MKNEPATTSLLNFFLSCSSKANEWMRNRFGVETQSYVEGTTLEFAEIKLQRNHHTARYSRDSIEETVTEADSGALNRGIGADGTYYECYHEET